MIEAQVKLDARNLNCPIPVMKVKKELRNMEPGEVIYVMATDPACPQDIDLLLQSTKDELLESTESGGEFHFYIQKTDS